MEHELMYWVQYSPIKKPLLLTKEQAKTYSKMMVAVGKGEPYITKAS